MASSAGAAKEPSAPPTVLVTGACGFLGSHCVWLLLHCGFNVRGTTRNVDSPKAEELLTLVDSLRLPASQFELVASDDLSDGGGWRGLLRGCRYCIHTACPDMLYEMDDASAVVTPAVIGVRSLLMVSRMSPEMSAVAHRIPCTELLPEPARGCCNDIVYSCWCVPACC